MNNKMAKISIYQQLNPKNNLSKQEQRLIMDTESVMMAARQEWGGGMGEEVRD